MTDTVSSTYSFGPFSQFSNFVSYVADSLSLRGTNAKQALPTTLQVSSFDFDGSLFHRGLIESDDKSVVSHNKEFLDALATSYNTNSQLDKHKVFVGSNRQSKIIDDVNAGHKGSCFPAIIQVVDYLNARTDVTIELDKLLLADIYAKRDAGESFDRAMYAAHDTQHPDWLFDSHKMSIIYAQVHKIASEHPNDIICFDFYDDRMDILTALHQFYAAHQDVLPANVSLNLHHYDGGSPEHLHNVNGAGEIDYGYRDTVCWMGQSASNIMVDASRHASNLRLSCQNGISPHVQANIAHMVDVPSLLAQQQACPEKINPLYDLELLPKPVLHKLEVLREKYSDLTARGCNAEANITMLLLKDLQRLSCQYFTARLNGDDNGSKEQDAFNEYKSACQERVDSALTNRLSTTRGHGDWQTALLFSVGTLGVFAPVAVASKLLTGKFMPFLTKTDTEKKVIECADAIRNSEQHATLSG